MSQTARARLRSHRGAGAPRTGAFGCFFIMLTGLMAGFFVPGNIPLGIERAGVLLMLATPVVRVMVACYLFFRKKTTSMDGSRWACW